ncbi:unnamed protein product [Rotaria socialis]|uniref:Phosphatidate phosphatase APP1 catalytic domain-containing protein n=1 Tax=Rotaria socialis TaxID=392032 RepID=A0A821RRG4_9BILA|nr:unnamed protein product [Rotaria socialis]
MTSYLQKYIAALSSATDYISQWSPNQALADEEHIVPFPTLAIFDRNKQIWLVHVKAWIYLPIETKTLADYLSSLSSLLIDIDDTIKFTNAINKTLLLKHTFYDCFEPITGMNELYQKWHEQKCQFHYVSANPWQLYPALRCFLAKYNFPMGTLNLRKFDWNLKFFYTIGTHKMKTISEIISAYPSRKYIFVGDSGELDPEIYAKLYANYSQSIAHIYIRDICQTSPCLPICEERYRKAFEFVPKHIWSIFKHPQEIDTDINKLVSI